MRTFLKAIPSLLLLAAALGFVAAPALMTGLAILVLAFLLAVFAFLTVMRGLWKLCEIIWR